MSSSLAKDFHVSQRCIMPTSFDLFKMRNVHCIDLWKVMKGFFPSSIISNEVKSFG